MDVEPGNERRHVVLRDDWIHTEVRAGECLRSVSNDCSLTRGVKGDVVNVIGAFYISPSSTSSKPLYTIDVSAKANLLILHPDILVTATSIANAPQCRRKPLLQNLVRSTTEITPALVWGNVLHEVMQTCLREESWDEKFMDAEISKVVRQNLGDLLKLDVTVEHAIREVKGRAGGLKTFADKYISHMPKACLVFSGIDPWLT